MAKSCYVDRYRGSILSKALFCDGVLLEFAMGGRFVAERPMDYSISTWDEVDVVSLLTNSGCCELATNINGFMVKNEIETDVSKAIQNIRKLSNMVFQGSRQDKTAEGISYTQYIFAFKPNYLTHDKVRSVIANG